MDPTSGQTGHTRGPSLRKALLVCGAAGGLVGSAIGAAVGTNGYARAAALIGGVPPGLILASAVGWYGALFGHLNRLRHGRRVGAFLGLLGGGCTGAIAGLSVWAFQWSLAGAVLGAMIHSSLVRPERRALGLFPGIFAGSLVGILVRAFRSESDGVTTGAICGGLVGTVVGVLLIPGLLTWLLGLTDVLRYRRGPGDPEDDDPAGSVSLLSD
jgi:hypothetical protein